MKIGIITILDGYNYGAFLQMYALVSFLQAKGNEVRVLDFSQAQEKEVQKDIARRSQLVISAFEASMHSMPILPYNGEWYDVIIVGSDEVWNIQNRYFHHYSEFFGHNLNCGRLVAYAPSCGFSSIKDYEQNSIETLGWNNFDCIMPRDKETQAIVSRFVSCPLNIVADPTLLLQYEWQQFVQTTPTKEKYVIYYSYKDNPALKDNLLRFSRENECKLVSLLFEREWCDETIYPTPIEFLSVLYNSEYIVTNTMHGTIFSVLLKKRFLNFSLGNKTLEFRNLAGLPEEWIYIDHGNYEDFCASMDRVYDYESIFSEIENHASYSRDLLLNAITFR